MQAQTIRPVTTLFSCLLLATGCGDLAGRGQGDNEREIGNETVELDDTSALGAYPVGYSETQFVDPAEPDRVLPAHIWYPAESFDEERLIDYTLAGFLPLPSAAAQRDVSASAEGPFPLIMFSHGYGGMSIQSQVLCETLASHGFVVVSADHTGNTTNDVNAGTDDDFDTAASYRPRDVKTVLDGMEALGRDQDSVVFGIIDEGQVGVTGHSFGGFTSLSAAAGYDAGGSDPDPRVKAIAPIAPNTDIFSREELAAVDVPTMYVVGTEDTGIYEPHVLPGFDAMTTEPRYRVDIDGANHFHFSNACDIGRALIDLGLEPDTWSGVGAGQLVPIYDVTCSDTAFSIDEAQRLQNKYVVAFFRAFLAGDVDYAGVLDPSHAASCESVVEVWAEGAPAVASASCSVDSGDDDEPTPSKCVVGPTFGLFEACELESLCEPATLDVVESCIASESTVLGQLNCAQSAFEADQTEYEFSVVDDLRFAATVERYGVGFLIPEVLGALDVSDELSATGIGVVPSDANSCAAAVVADGLERLAARYPMKAQTVRDTCPVLGQPFPEENPDECVVEQLELLSCDGAGACEG